MIDFTDDELYELEKTMDVYGGWIMDRLIRTISLHGDSKHYEDAEVAELPLKKTVNELLYAQMVNARLRDKLKKYRRGE